MTLKVRFTENKYETSYGLEGAPDLTLQCVYEVVCTDRQDGVDVIDDVGEINQLYHGEFEYVVEGPVTG